MTYKCPACGHQCAAHTQHRGSNRSNTVTFEVPEHMVAALARATLIGSTTAMMSRRAEEEIYMRALSTQLKSQIPWPATVFDPQDWVVIATRITAHTDVIFEVVNTGSTWRPVWQISARASGDADWPAKRFDNSLMSKKYDCESGAQKVLIELQEEASRLSPM